MLFYKLNEGMYCERSNTLTMCNTTSLGETIYSPIKLYDIQCLYPQQPILLMRYCIQLMIIAKYKHFRLYIHTWIISAMKHQRCYKIIHKHIYSFIQLYNRMGKKSLA